MPRTVQNLDLMFVAVCKNRDFMYRAAYGLYVLCAVVGEVFTLIVGRLKYGETTVSPDRVGLSRCCAFIDCHYSVSGMADLASVLHRMSVLRSNVLVMSLYVAANPQTL